MKLALGKSHHTIIEYVQNETQRFADRGFGAVDSLVLSKMSYWHFEGIVPGPEENTAVAIRSLMNVDTTSMFKRARDIEDNRRLLAAVVESPRFRHARMMHYVQTMDQDEEKQFSAVTFLLEDDTAYVAFRGTDGTLVGWKEDFNMAFTSPVPAQEAGVGYLHETAKHTGRPLRIGGHSKGGNIAIYAAVKCRNDLKGRVLEVYSHDGPGFRKEFLDSEGYKKLASRIKRTIPQSSLVGMLLYQRGEYAVVESNRFGIMQHDPFSWAVQGDDFLYAQRLTSSASYMNRTLDKWLRGYSDQKRKLLIDTLYDVIAATNATTYEELIDNWHKKALTVFSSYRDVDEETRRFIHETLVALISMTIRNIPKEAGKTIKNSGAYQRVMKVARRNGGAPKEPEVQDES